MDIAILFPIANTITLIQFAVSQLHYIPASIPRLLYSAGAITRLLSSPAVSSSLTCLQVQVQVQVTLRLTFSQSVSLGVEPRPGLMTRYLLLLNVTVLFFYGASSLTRGRVCLIYMLLALVSAVFLGSESLGARDHILLSQI